MTMVAKPSNFEEEMRSAFKVFDKDGSGTISKEEMAQVMKKFGEDLSSEDLDIMLQEVDKNGDGTIDCESC
jgi:calmodulin